MSYRFSSNCYYCISSNEWPRCISFDRHRSACNFGAIGSAASLSHLARWRREFIRMYAATCDTSWKLTDNVCLITRTSIKCSFLCDRLQWIWDNNRHRWRAINFQCYWLRYCSISFSLNCESSNEWSTFISFHRHGSACDIGVSRAATLSHLARRRSKMIRNYWASRISSWELIDDIGLITRTDRPCSFLRRSLQWIWHINLYTRSTFKRNLPGINTRFGYILTYSTVIVTCSTTPRIVFASTKSMTRLWTFT